MQKSKSLKLVSWGKDELENTIEFRLKINDIKKEVTQKYSHALKKKSNVFVKLWLHIRISLEVRERIKQISSYKNLHISYRFL